MRPPSPGTCLGANMDLGWVSRWMLGCLGGQIGSRKGHSGPLANPDQQPHPAWRENWAEGLLQVEGGGPPEWAAGRGVVTTKAE